MSRKNKLSLNPAMVAWILFERRARVSTPKLAAVVGVNVTTIWRICGRAHVLPAPYSPPKNGAPVILTVGEWQRRLSIRRSRDPVAEMLLSGL